MQSFGETSSFLRPFPTATHLITGVARPTRSRSASPTSQHRASLPATSFFPRFFPRQISSRIREEWRDFFTADIFAPEYLQ